MTTGEKIINSIISGTLAHAECAESKDHGCIVIWSSGAAEQIDAVVEQELAALRAAIDKHVAVVDQLRQERDALRLLVDRAPESDSIVASCNCGVKSGDIQYHKPGCKYRLISERDALRSEVDGHEKQRQHWLTLTATQRKDTDALRLEVERRRGACAAVSAERDALRAEVAETEARRKGWQSSFENENTRYQHACKHIDAIERERDALRAEVAKEHEYLEHMRRNFTSACQERDALREEAATLRVDLSLKIIQYNTAASERDALRAALTKNAIKLQEEIASLKQRLIDHENH